MIIVVLDSKFYFYDIFYTILIIKRLRNPDNHRF